MPPSTAAWIVLTDSSSSVPPHIQPPIAHVPRPIRETFSEVPVTLTNLLSNSPVIQSPMHWHTRETPTAHALSFTEQHSHPNAASSGGASENVFSSHGRPTE